MHQNGEPTDRSESVEWDIDNNRPVYTLDFIMLYGIDSHLCDCHLKADRCYGCESLNCQFHAKRRV